MEFLSSFIFLLFISFGIPTSRFSFLVDDYEDGMSGKFKNDDGWVVAGVRNWGYT